MADFDAQQAQAQAQAHQFQFEQDQARIAFLEQIVAIFHKHFDTCKMFHHHHLHISLI